MANVTLTIPDVPEEVVHGLEALAAASGRTVADEARELLAERLPSERERRQAALDRTRERRARMKPTTPDLVERGILDGRPWSAVVTAVIDQRLRVRLLAHGAVLTRGR